MHDAFHVSILGHYNSDPTYVFDMISLQVSDEGTFMAKLVHILDHYIQHLWRRTIDQVKVQWNNYSLHSTTLEDTYDMHQQFPFLFDR